MLARVSAIFNRIFLILSVDNRAHALDQFAAFVGFEQIVPIAAPHHFDNIPARAAEHAFQFLNDFAVAAHRPVQSLQVAVDDPDQVVQLFISCDVDRAQGFGFAGFAVAYKRPNVRVFFGFQAAIFEVAIETRLINRANRAKSHRNRGELPEVRHQPRMRIT